LPINIIFLSKVLSNIKALPIIAGNIVLIFKGQAAKNEADKRGTQYNRPRLGRQCPKSRAAASESIFTLFRNPADRHKTAAGSAKP
jgi:hypothetical protein